MKTKSIPSFLAILILILVIGILSFIKDQSTKLFSKASGGTPQVNNLEIANLSESGWTVSWTTSAKTAGAIFYGKNELASDAVAPDDRDKEPLAGSYYVHHVTVRDQHPGAYFFRIGVNQGRIGREGLAPYAVLLPTPLSGGVKSDPIYGKVNNATLPASGAVVIFTAAGSQSLSGLTNDGGNFILPVTMLRAVDLKSLMSLKDGAFEQLKIIGPDLSTSIVTCIVGHDRPVPTVTLGQNLNCAPTTLPISTPQRTSLPSGENLSAPSLNLLEGEELDQLPTFSGKAGPSQKVEIEVHSETPVNAAVVAGTDGKWSWTPPKTLAPGEHTMTITAKNPDGTTDIITRKFIVFADTNLLPVTSGEKFSTVSAVALITPPLPPTPARIAAQGVAGAPPVATKAATPIKILPKSGTPEGMGSLVIASGVFLLIAYLARRAGNLA